MTPKPKPVTLFGREGDIDKSEIARIVFKAEPLTLREWIYMQGGNCEYHANIARSYGEPSDLRKARLWELAARALEWIGRKRLGKLIGGKK
jgi:hypothetical protein